MFLFCFSNSLSLELYSKEHEGIMIYLEFAFKNPIGQSFPAGAKPWYLWEQPAQVPQDWGQEKALPQKSKKLSWDALLPRQGWAPATLTQSTCREATGSTEP